MSTIILKNGTGLAIPSALSHGEPAINVETGLFYYGSGSRGAVKNFSNFINITASFSASLGGNISASGTISAFGSSSLVGLPTTEPSITGALWLSGSGGGSASGSKYLMVFTG